MRSHQSVPRDLRDIAPPSLSPSGTFDLRDILGQAKLLPRLLAEDLLFDVDDMLSPEVDRFPSFPTTCHPPLFTLDSHLARLPFPLRPDAFDMGDIHLSDGGACFLLTAPTVPRVKRMMKEQLYVQKWVDALTSDNPPKHIPWTCEKPAAKRKWVAEGSIFPADVIKTSGAIHGRSCVTDTNSGQALCTRSEATASMHAPLESRASTPTIRIKSADGSPGILRGESKASHIPHCIVRTPQESSPPTMLHSGLPSEITSSNPYVPLATRRGKSLSGLKLQGRVLERLEYPDIPTAFRGSPVVWSPRFGTFPAPRLTDHESMISDLMANCSVLGREVATYIQDPVSPQTEPGRTSLSIDEWIFARGLATFDSGFSGSIGSHASKEINAEMSIFVPDAVSTPVKGPGFTAHLEFVHRLRSTPALQSPRNCPSDPPADPLPPRPALVNPSTPSHIRGILKKAKSVRFEDMIAKQPENCTLRDIPLPQASPERSSPSTSVIPSVRPCTPIPNTAKPSGNPAPIKEALRKNVQKRSVPRSRQPPRRARSNTKLAPSFTSLANTTPEPYKLSPATNPIGRPCRIVHTKENANPIAIPRAQTKRKGVPITEIDVRRGIEGTAKSRLSTPLRNIFRLR